MSLTVLDNQFRIKIANDDFFNALYKSSIKSKKAKVLFQIYKNKKLEYFYSNSDIYKINGLDFWFSRIEKDYRYIYVFGVDELKDTDPNVPICTIDFSITGTNQDTSAVFAQDKHGNVSVLYRVNQQDLSLNSFELEFEGEWIQAQERDKNNYFILIGKLNNDLLGTFKDFLTEIEQNVKDSKVESVETSTDKISSKSCVICDQEIKSAKSDYDSIIKDLGIEDGDYCKDCLEKIAAAILMKKIGQKINLKVFNKHSLLERVDDPAVFETCLDFLIKMGFLKEITQGLLVSNKEKDMDELLEKYDENKKTPQQPSQPEKKCVKCGAVLTASNSYKSDSSNGISDKCKDCYRKIYAAKALYNLEKYVDPGIPFSKNDLLKQVDNRTKYLDYVWTLQEFDLLETDESNDLLILKPKEQLTKFKEEFGKEIKESKAVISKDKTIPQQKKPSKIVKKCEICDKTLPISKYYKSSITEDGFTDKCKDCSRKSYAAKALIELKSYVEPEVEFYKDDLLKQADNRTQLLDYFWTLQEFDFIEHDEKANTYVLKPEDEINLFIKQYGEQIAEPTPELQVTENVRKAVKECKTCKQTLPVSDFYKSSESADGYTENCKKCSDKITAANILSEIKKYIGIGNPFSKKELSNQLGNPTKVSYYIWTLQEHNLISYDDRKDTYIVEDNPNYKDYEALLAKLSSLKTSTISTDSDEEIIKTDIDEVLSEKRIIGTSETHDSNRVMILRAVIPKNDLYPTLNNMKDVITLYMINMTLNKVDDNLIKLIVELEIENKSYEQTLKFLQEKDWNGVTKEKNL